MRAACCPSLKEVLKKGICDRYGNHGTKKSIAKLGEARVTGGDGGAKGPFYP